MGEGRSHGEGKSQATITGKEDGNFFGPVSFVDPDYSSAQAKMLRCTTLLR